ncbi:hypothetical protein HL670_03069 [Serratia plymuthica]|uniref:hypothetical protein n=1 Tax=Serratia TaxID=613 RepID=UPI0007231425|nr:MULTISPECIES: hypothetical protein [Serratia]QJW56180.1 hypothetical protein HL670_03069 [Serratia plymuthica]GAK26234.1 hypothetical protein SLIQ_06145 [Serratia liquefaciens FK01]
MERVDIIKNCISSGRKHEDIIGQVYLSMPTFAFEKSYEKQYNIMKMISEKLNVPYFNIQVTGSAKIGVSLHKKKSFSAASSDLDVAIIDQNLFIKISEAIFKETSGLTRRDLFEKYKDSRTGNEVDKHSEYKRNLLKGIILDNCMPSGVTKREWVKLFEELSKDYRKDFKSISGAIYLSQYYFINKQKSIIQHVNGFEVIK